MKEKKSIEVVLGGQRLNLRTDTNVDAVHAAAALVNEKLSSIVPKGELLSQQALLVLSMILADEVLNTRRNNEEFRSVVKERSEAILNKLENHFEV